MSEKNNTQSKGEKEQNNILYLTPSKLVGIRFGDSGKTYTFVFDKNENDRNNTLINNLKKLVDVSIDENSGVATVYLKKRIVGQFSPETGVSYDTKVTAYETRKLSNSDIYDTKELLDKELNNKFTPRTDLHTHFAGVLPPKTLVKIGLDHDISVPLWVLNKVNVDVSKFENDYAVAVPLAKINQFPEEMDKLKNAMKIPTIEQETFNKLEDVYTVRSVFTKTQDLFEDMLKEVGKYYGKRGVEYVELSTADVVDKLDFLKIIHEKVPQIEKETGVKIRFLAALWRHSDREWNLDEVDRIKTLAQSPYVVGSDFMGHENNRTKDIEPELRKLVRWSVKNDPDFVIRVHAGENSVYTDNVKEVFQIIKSECENLKKENPTQNISYPKVRIGHGIYGLAGDAKGTLDLAKELNATIEINMNSNIALNNVDNLDVLPISKYMSEGVNVVLGTDGPGIYNTTPKQEATLAAYYGLKSEQINKIMKIENQVISDSEKSFKRKTKEFEETYKVKLEEFNPDKQFIFKFSTEDGKPRYNREVQNEKSRVTEENIHGLLNKLIKSGAEINTAKINDKIKDKCPVFITGSSVHTWDKVAFSHRHNIKELIDEMVQKLDPKSSYIVTGGTDVGVDNLVRNAVARRNKELSKEEKLILLGAFVLSSADPKTKIEPNSYTDAVLLKMPRQSGTYVELESIAQNLPRAENLKLMHFEPLHNTFAKTQFDIPDALFNFLKANKGEMVAIGGGAAVKDMIQRAHNQGGIGVHLMCGPRGASTEKTFALDGLKYSFTNIDELLERLKSSKKDIVLSAAPKEKAPLPNKNKEQLQQGKDMKKTEVLKSI